MQNIKNKNRMKMILKLIIVIPLFYLIGIYIGKSYINGNYFSFLILTSICIVTGKILAKI